MRSFALQSRSVSHELITSACVYLLQKLVHADRDTLHGVLIRRHAHLSMLMRDCQALIARFCDSLSRLYAALTTRTLKRSAFESFVCFKTVGKVLTFPAVSMLADPSCNTTGPSGGAP